jgi:hypothetical protein
MEQHQISGMGGISLHGMVVHEVTPPCLEVKINAPLVGCTAVVLGPAANAVLQMDPSDCAMLNTLVMQELSRQCLLPWGQRLRTCLPRPQEFAGRGEGLALPGLLEEVTITSNY